MKNYQTQICMYINTKGTCFKYLTFKHLVAEKSQNAVLVHAVLTWFVWKKDLWHVTKFTSLISQPFLFKWRVFHCFQTNLWCVIALNRKWSPNVPLWKFKRQTKVSFFRRKIVHAYGHWGKTLRYYLKTYLFLKSRNFAKTLIRIAINIISNIKSHWRKE